VRAPEFWRTANPISTALLPAAALYDAAGRWRRAGAVPFRASVPVVCVGNLVAGGAGKTPLALHLAERLGSTGVEPSLLTRGYGGRLAGPVAVDPERHDFRAVGDEPLLLARHAATWVARDRAAGAAAAVAAGAQAIVMDDGLQNPGLAHDLAVIAIDGGYGFGNGRVIPAGPLRERLEVGLARVQAAILIGEDETEIAATLGGAVPLIRARLVPSGDAAEWQGRRVLAFAGIGRPTKFFATLEGLGAELAGIFAFADHHPYEEAEVMALVARAAAASALPVTTEKDWVRLPQALRAHVQALPVRLAVTDGAETLDRLLAAAMGRA
jgi:tetraacyldisaccharide 4'-kinase